MTEVSGENTCPSIEDGVASSRSRMADKQNRTVYATMQFKSYLRFYVDVVHSGSLVEMQNKMCAVY